MQPYWRAESRRFEQREAREFFEPTFVLPAAMPRIAVLPPEETVIVSRPQFDADFFSFALERALRGEDDALGAIARCEAWTVSRAFRCGGERVATDGWCGSPLCGSCAEVRAEEAARVARGRWPEVVFTVDVPIGIAGKPGLPGADEVVLARDAWARAAKAAAPEVGRVEGLPRGVVTPDGLALFVQPPVGVSDERADDVARALEQHARSHGHSRTVVRAVGREEAARAVTEALTLEARRFREDPSGRWQELARERHADLRRPLVFGAREALPLPDARGVAVQPAACHAHGEGCAETAAVVRDASGRELLRAAPLPARATRQALLALVRFAASASADGEALRKVA